MIGVLIVIFPGDFTIVKRLVSYNLSGKSTSTSPYEESNIQGLPECMEAPLNQTEMDVFFVFFCEKSPLAVATGGHVAALSLAYSTVRCFKRTFFFFLQQGTSKQSVMLRNQRIALLSRNV